MTFQQKKEALEIRVACLIADFEKTTGTVVDTVDVMSPGPLPGSLPLKECICIGLKTEEVSDEQAI